MKLIIYCILAAAIMIAGCVIEPPDSGEETSASEEAAAEEPSDTSADSAAEEESVSEAPADDSNEPELEVAEEPPVTEEQLKKLPQRNRRLLKPKFLLLLKSLL